jgi:exodeoxyribonuclease-3
LLKITTWNVNGLRALLRKDGWEWVTAFRPDVLCLQEIKARPDQLSKEQHVLFEPYQAVWNPAERPGYSGVLTLLALPELTSSLGLGYDHFDIEGRVIQTHFDDFTLFNIYFPNGGRDHSRVPFKLDFYAALLDLCDEMHARGQQVIICGDINTSHQEIDLKNHKTNHNTTGFLPEERAWITKYLEHGFVDAFRALYPEKEQYTWWTFIGNARARNVGWRLDYFLVSGGLMSRVQDVVIHDEVMGSDHCPVTLFIE